jgi:DNA-binding CsgD family transcriptional regulator
LQHHCLAEHFDLDSVTEAALAAAVDPVRWPDVLQPLVSAFEGKGAFFGLVDKAASQMRYALMQGFQIDPISFWREYSRDMALRDPHVHAIAMGSGPRIVTDSDYADQDSEATREYLDWIEARLSTRHHITFATDAVGFSTGLAVHRTRAMGPMGAADRALMGAIGRKLSPAFSLAAKHREVVTESFWNGVTGQAAKAACLIDEHGRIIRASALMEAQFQSMKGLTTVSGRLSALDAAVDARLQAAIHQAVDAGDRHASTVPLPRDDGEPSVLVSLYPLPIYPTAAFDYGRASTLVVVTDPQATSVDTTLLLRQAFDLTVQEARIARRLAAGDSVDAIAAALQISRETVRVHLRHIFAKTGLRRQLDLVRVSTQLTA